MDLMQWFTFACSCLALCSSEVINCTVSQHDDQTTYNVSNGPHVSSANCRYSWANGSVHEQDMLAHNKGEIPELVMRNSINTLVTSKCFDKVVYYLICDSEGQRHSANCTTNCGAKPGFQEDKEISHHWIAAIVAILVLVVMALGFLCRKILKKKLAAVAAAVKTQICDAKAADLEARNEQQDAFL